MTIVRTLELGRVDYNATGRRTHPVSITLELRPPQGKNRLTTDLEPRPDDAVCLSIVGSIWTKSRNDTVTSGQCYNEIRKFFPDDDRVQMICDVWRKWHLNDMRAGTTLQTEYYREHLRKLENDGRELGTWDYDRICGVLKDGGLYIDRGYKYGSQWLHEIIPDDVLDGIKRLFDL